MRKSVRIKLRNKRIVFGSGIGAICIVCLCYIGILVLPKLGHPSILQVRVIEGTRKEEVAQIFAQKLGWSQKDTQTFIENNNEGYTYPTTYTLSSQAKPQEVTNAILTTFATEVYDKEPKFKTHEANIDSIIKIASIIEREAYGKNDMNIISGIIWNRLAKGMNLEMDATLQYVKGTTTQWWPAVKSQDKNLESPFNTYKNKGLPPSAIANPGPDAISAALNPTKTKALFYIHDRSGRIHTAETYAQHLANINTYLR